MKTVPSWARATSVPTALLGVVTFFLPWFQFSSRQLSLSTSISGYEFATGGWQRQFDPKRADDFWNRLKSTQATGRSLSKRPSQRTHEPLKRADPAVTWPLLWAVPAGCLLLAVLGLFGLPRVATAAVSAIASGYLAYFGVSLENQARDPATTGGILGHDWLPAFWATWVALLVPIVFSHVRRQPDDRPTESVSAHDDKHYLSIR